VAELVLQATRISTAGLQKLGHNTNQCDTLLPVIELGPVTIWYTPTEYWTGTPAM